MNFWEQLKNLDIFGQIPKVVVIGGGTGLATFLKGLKHFTAKITAIVTVTDDGGSSGRIRKDMGILPPGDIRNCLVALAEAEPLMKKLMEYRFKDDGEIEGHSFGNLFIAAMTDITGNFASGVKESSRIMSVKGSVLPVSEESLVLCADLVDGSSVVGETNVNSCKSRIKKVYLKGSGHRALPETIEAIREADMIVLGPGSLYTSVITNLLVDGVSDAIRESDAIKVYVCNIMTEKNETLEYTASEHVKAIIDHAGEKIIDWIIVNNAKISKEMLDMYYQMEGARQVPVDMEELEKLGLKVKKANLVLEKEVIRHKSRRLASEVLSLLNDESTW